MKRRDYRDYLLDILNSINDIEEFIREMTFSEFTQDRKTINAVVRALEVIGEAVKKIPEKLKKRYPDIPWKEMTGMRNKLIHEYFGIDFEMVWKVIEDDLPKLKPQIEKMLDDLRMP